MTRLFLCGDVMIGRGIDQVMPRSVDPQLFEQFVGSATTYVELAEQAHGPIPRAVPPDYVWGSALEAIDAFAPDARVVNLETTMTSSPKAWPGKGIHYRAHPANVAVLKAGRIDCCVLANNHVLDWGVGGLLETLEALEQAGLATAGAGRDLPSAQAPAVLDAPPGRVIVFGLASTTSGTPGDWAALPGHPGVNLVSGWSTDLVDGIGSRIESVKRSGDIVVASIHWGSNWGYEIPSGQRRLAHALIDAGIDLVHGHSSHHPRPIERYRRRLILYGCGDFITDYEGIGGYESYRGDLAIAWFPTLDPSSGETVTLRMAPFRLRRFQLAQPAVDDLDWLAEVLARHSASLGVRVERAPDGTLVGLF